MASFLLGVLVGAVLTFLWLAMVGHRRKAA
jgi:hypothetical protein